MAFFETYVVGFLLNMVAGIVCFFIIRWLFGWLPTREDLGEKFRTIRMEKDEREKLVALTHLVFISFYWLFVANLLWVLLGMIIELLYWPQLAWDLTSGTWLQNPTISLSADSAVSGFIEDILPGLIIGRSLLFIVLSAIIVLCFYRGLAIAKQCWEVYRAMDKS